MKRFNDAWARLSGRIPKEWKTVRPSAGYPGAESSNKTPTASDGSNSQEALCHQAPGAPGDSPQLKVELKKQKLYEWRLKQALAKTIDFTRRIPPAAAQEGLEAKLKSARM